MRWSYTLTAPAVAGVVLAPGPLLYVCVALTSAGLYVPFSLHITLGQDYLPGRAGTAAGVIPGLAVSIGGIAGPVIGALADASSLRLARVPLIALPPSAYFSCGLCASPDPGVRDRVAPSASALMTCAYGGP